MRNYRRNILFTCAITLASASAFATYCGPGTVHAGQGEPWWPNDCNKLTTPVQPVVQPTQATATSESAARSEANARSAANARQRQQMQQAQQQAQQTQQRSSQQARTGDMVVQGAQPGSGDHTEVNTVFIPAAPMTAPSTVTPGAIASADSQVCGPLKIIVRTPIFAVMRGPFGGESLVYQGDHQDTVDAMDYRGDPIGYKKTPMPGGGGWILWGHHEMSHRTVLSGAMLAQASFNLFGSNGGGGGGAGVSGSVNKFGKEVDLFDCQVGTLVIEVSRVRGPAMMPDRVKHKPVKARVKPCVWTTKPICVPVKP